MEPEIGKLSSFNEATYQMFRIHELQSRVNLANLNPLHKFRDEDNPDLFLYGYQVLINSLSSLFIEVSSKLSADELREGLAIKDKIELFLFLAPVYQSLTNDVTHLEEVKINSVNWIKLKRMLFNYQMMVRRFLEKHKMTSPTGDRPEEAGYK